VIQKGSQSRFTAPWHQKELVVLGQTSGQIAFWTIPRGGVCMSYQEEAPGQTVTHWIDYLPRLSRQCFGVRPEELEEVARGVKKRGSLVRLLLLQPCPREVIEHDGWLNG